MHSILTATAIALLGIAGSEPSGFAIPWHSIDGGAGRAQSTTFVLDGGTGQPDAGVALVSATFSLEGGFYAGMRPASAVCLADLDHDGSVQASDLSVLLGAWGACPSLCAADLDHNGQVDAADLAVLLASWGDC